MASRVSVELLEVGSEKIFSQSIFPSPGHNHGHSPRSTIVQEKRFNPFLS